MPRLASIPDELTHGPFSVDQARLAGLTRWQLQGKSWRPLGNGVYVLAALPESPMLSLAAVRRRLPPEAVFSGRTAAWLHGLDVSPCDPIEVTIPPDCGVSARTGVSIRRSCIEPGEVVVRRDMTATSIVRTLMDLGQRLTWTEGVVIADMALHMGLTDLAE